MHRFAILTLGLAGALSPALASPPAPPAGITWRNQAPPPHVGAPPHHQMDQGARPIRQIVIKRGHDGAKSDHYQSRTFSGHGGPTRVIARRERVDEFDPEMVEEFERLKEGHEPDSDNRHYQYENDYDRYADEEDAERRYEPRMHHPGHGHGYVQAPCCSGGMITETITTTTTYPPTAEKHVVHREVRSYDKRRPSKRLRR